MKAMSRPTGRRSGPHGLQHALAPRADRLERAAGEVRRDDHRAREHALWLTTDVTWSWNGQRFKRLPKIAQPNKTFYTTGKLESGVRYGYIPDAAHTDGDLYVYFPKQNVLAVGDAVSGRGLAGRGLADRRMDWRHRRRPSTVADDRQRARRGSCPGADRCSSLADLKTQSEMYGDDLRAPVADAEQRARADARPWQRSRRRNSTRTWAIGDEFVRRSFESLWAYLSPDA